MEVHVDVLQGSGVICLPASVEVEDDAGDPSRVPQGPRAAVVLPSMAG